MASMGRRRAPVHRLAALIGAAAAALALAGCEDTSAPSDRGVCWRGGPHGFEVLARQVATLDDCAALLEAVHLQGAAQVNGAFQGYFLFVDSQQVASSTTANGFHYPIFQPSQRAQIDSDLKALIREHGGAGPGDIAVQRR